MKTKRILQIIVVSVLFVLAYTSCRKETSTSSTSNSKLGVQIQAVNKSVQLPVQSSVLQNASLTPGATVTWDTASLWVSTLKFEAEMKAKLMAANMANEDEHHPGFSRDSIKITFEWHGPQKVDLFNVNTVFGGFSLGPGLYNEEELSVAGLRGDAGSDTIFYLSGTYTTSNLQVKRIRVPVKESVLFKTEQDSVEVTGTGINLVGVIQIYLDKLMAGIPVSSLDNATLQSNGDILISRNSNPDLYYIILRNLRLHHPFHHRWGHFEH
jgi:hypothetical protein